MHPSRSPVLSEDWRLPWYNDTRTDTAPVGTWKNFGAKFLGPTTPTTMRRRSTQARCQEERRSLLDGGGRTGRD